MKTNVKSSTLLSLDRKSKTNFQQSPNSLTLVQSANQVERPNQPQKNTISRIYVEQAWIYFQAQNWQGAIVACKNALESDSNNADAYKILGNVLKSKGKKAEALGVYAKALALNPNSAPIYANLGSFYAEQKDWQQALDYYQQAVILDPNLAGAYRSLAQVWEELGDTNQALECFCQAVNLEPEKLTSAEYFSFGRELYQQGKVKEASIFYTHGVQLNPQAKAELAQLVEMLEELEEWQQAVVYYHQLISLSDHNLNSQDSSLKAKPIKKLLSHSKFNQAKKAIALATLEAVTSSLAKSTTQKLLPQAEAETEPTVNQPAQTKQPNATSWHNLGSLYAQKQQWAKAISCYQEAIQLEPSSSQTYRNLAKAYSKIGKQSKAALCWYEAFTLEPDRVKPEEYFSLAKSLLQQNQVARAIACLRQTIRLKPDFARAYLIMGKLFENQGKSAAAQACYERAGKTA
jgi:tetratricopeptide (TPR) repeat protein